MSHRCYSNVMSVEEIRGQRILTSVSSPKDELRLEVFAKNIPQYLNEDDIVPFFEKVGPVHILRLMLNKNNRGNRGFAYLTYLNSDDAKTAIKTLNGKEIVPNCPITVTQSMNNCRIFLGGIPVKKTKDEVWQELNKRGITGIVDVIMYRSYNNRAQNRGFVFVEFPTHQYAAKMRNKMKGMSLWNNEVIVDWSVPEAVVSDDEMKKVKILYLRNLNVMESRDYLKAIIEMYMNPEFIEKVYKFKDYAFIHLTSRKAATELLDILKKHYRNTAVEVTFAKPSNEFTKPEYRKMILSKSSTSPPASERSPSTRQKNFSEREEEMRFLNSLQRIHPNTFQMNENFPELLDPYRHMNLASSSPDVAREQNYATFATPEIQRRMGTTILNLPNLQEAFGSLQVETSRENEPFLSSTPILKCSNSYERNLYPFGRALEIGSFASPLNAQRLHEAPERPLSDQKNTPYFVRENNVLSCKENLSSSHYWRHLESKPNQHKDKENWPTFPCSWADILCKGEPEAKPFSSIGNIPDHSQGRTNSRRSFLESDRSLDEFNLFEERVRKCLYE
ncbi:APOBEC1 complementation factor-like [Coccinella septempunctata]|uniref:APOBEC1 complementation factor-like n=1 Tax=Coccinella septempunctata TaxID=41139 RepID=UPI001D06A080|nr:APOBEC1 complementation factor-like [Coccinella septempunctata]